jgi:uncharacterized protein YcfJ
MRRFIALGLWTGLFLAPLGALADSSGAVTGAAGGAVTGAVVGGPVGAAVGAGAGAVVGGAATADKPDRVVVPCDKTRWATRRRCSRAIARKDPKLRSL